MLRSLRLPLPPRSAVSSTSAVAHSAPHVNRGDARSLRPRSRCQRLKSVDGAPHAQADPFGHLRKVDHVVSQEDEHRTVFRISLPPTSECTRPTDRSHAATPHEIGFVRLQHHRDTQAKSSTSVSGQAIQGSRAGCQSTDWSIIAASVSGRRSLTPSTSPSPRKSRAKFQIVVERGPKPGAAGFVGHIVRPF